MEFFTRFSPAKSVSVDVSSRPSLTQQQFRDECDVNYIIEHFQDPARPSLVQPSVPRVPLFGDFSQIPDVRSAHAIFQRAEAEFSALPADVRAKFDNNPVSMMAFLETSSVDQIKQVFGAAPEKPVASVVDPVPGVSSVNAETVSDQNS